MALCTCSGEASYQPYHITRLNFPNWATFALSLLPKYRGIALCVGYGKMQVKFFINRQDQRKARSKRPSDAGSYAYNPVCAARLFSVTGARIYPGQACSPLRPDVFGPVKELCRTVFWGAGELLISRSASTNSATPYTNPGIDRNQVRSGCRTVSCRPPTGILASGFGVIYIRNSLFSNN